MPRTASDNRAFWLNRADNYSREASRAKNEPARQRWHERAAEARLKAATY